MILHEWFLWVCFKSIGSRPSIWIGLSITVLVLHAHASQSILSRQMFSTESIRASILFARKGKYGAFLLEETVQSSRNSTTVTSRSLSRANQTLKRLWNFVIDSEKLDVRDWDTIRLIIHPSDRKANVYSHHRLVYNSIEHRRLFRGKEIEDIYPSHTTSIQHSILHWVVVLNTLILRAWRDGFLVQKVL